MRRGVMHLVASALLALPFVAAPGTGSFHETLVETGDREFVLVMQGHAFNGFRHPDTPLLEAFLGERVGVTVTVPPFAEAHTFHLHGHPWLIPETGRIVDTVLLKPGDVHRFLVTAGGVDGHPGEWMYHCHVDAHSEGGMWGVFRVYPYATRIEGAGASFVVALDRLGEPVDGASIALALDDAPVAARVTPLGDGRYAVDAPALAGATGALVVTAEHAALGTSVARAGLGGADPAPALRGAAHVH